MEKILALSVIVVFLSTSVLCGCTEPVEDTVDVTQLVELVSHHIATIGDPPGIYHEVRGEVKNIADRDIDKISVYVTFLDADNETLYVGSYTIYQFIENMTGVFVVEFSASKSGFEDYDHYGIEIKIDE